MILFAAIERASFCFFSRFSKDSFSLFLDIKILTSLLIVTPITDIKIHRNDLVLSTMGRSFWILDDINYLRSKLSFSSPKIIDPSKAILYRYNIPEIEVNDYLTPGVFIDYFLDNNYKEIKLSIFNDLKCPLLSPLGGVDFE